MPFPEGKQFTIKDKTFHFSVASRMMDLLRGLSGVTSLGEYDGMLFDFGHETSIVMTPRGLKFPIEVAFISEDGEIKEITSLDPLIGFTQASTEEVRFALEVPVGFFDRNGIVVGDVVTL
jgi:uncharacterized membrane protein (UPF0127 family)